MTGIMYMQLDDREREFIHGCDKTEAHDSKSTAMDSTITEFDKNDIKDNL